MGIEFWIQRERGQLQFLEVHADLFNEILREQVSCPWIARFRDIVTGGRGRDFSIRDDGMVLFQGRVVVPDLEDLRSRIMREAHATPYSIHPGSNKMYQDI